MQAIVIASTSIITLLSAILSALLFSNYRAKKGSNYLFWGTGIALFAFGTLLEALFAAGAYSGIFAKLYLFIVAALVSALAVGSVQLAKSRRIRQAYYIFTVLSLVFVLYSLAVTSIGNILVGYVVYAVLPLLVVTASSVATFPAALAIIVMAALSYKHTKNVKMLSIIAGVIIVSIAGTLYIVQFPATLYYAEAIGIVLLWAGFYSRKSR